MPRNPAEFATNPDLRALMVRANRGRWLRSVVSGAAILVLLFFPAGSVFAEQVTPNGRVTTKLRVRAEPASDAEVVGRLAAGERAPLVRTTGAWREITFKGRSAYVTSSFTEVVPDGPGSAPTPTAGTGTSIRLGSWNIKKVGHGDHEDFAALARVFNENFDIVAIVEVMQKQHGHPGYDQLKDTLGTRMGRAGD